MTWSITTARRNALLDGIDDDINGGLGAGILAIYGGTKKALSVAPDGTTPLLAKFTLADPAFAAAAAGAMDIDADPDLETTAVETGTATWARFYSSTDGSTILEANAVAQCDVGTSGSDINLNTTTITNGGTVRITSGNVTAPGS